LLVGDGPMKNKLEEYVNNNFNGQVTFAGYVKYNELPKYYGISDLFVHTSNNEPWGVSVQEALASGLPVITSQFVGASVDLIQAGKNGFIYNSKNIQELKKNLLTALSFDQVEVKRINDIMLKNWSYTSTLNTLLRFLNTK
jgi:glycosyltransferase involved in cell wall biosynthesis